MNKNEKKARIIAIKQNSNVKKGINLTRFIVVLGILLSLGLQGYLYVTSQEINPISLANAGLQIVMLLLMLLGSTWCIVLYLLTMIVSCGVAVVFYLPNQSLFYLVQIVFFAVSALLMLILLIAKNARLYRSMLKDAKEDSEYEEEEEEDDDDFEEDIESQKKDDEPSSVEMGETLPEKPNTRVNFDYYFQDEKESSPQMEEIQEEVQIIEEEPIVEELETQTIQKETQVEVAEEPIQLEPEKQVELSYIQCVCPPDVNLTYGSFSRFLIQHYPFISLHPRFDLTKSKKVQFCINADAFDETDELNYTSTFMFHHKSAETHTMVVLAYETELEHLSALICVDWLISQKGILVENNQNANDELMEYLTKAFNNAKSEQKSPFTGFSVLS